MTLDNSLINDTFLYPYASDYNAPLTPVCYSYTYNNNNNSSNNFRVSLKSLQERFFKFQVFTFN